MFNNKAFTAFKEDAKVASANKRVLTFTRKITLTYMFKHKEITKVNTLKVHKTFLFPRKVSPLFCIRFRCFAARSNLVHMN